MKRLSSKRSKIEGQKASVYIELDEEQGGCCQECGSPVFDHSHHFPRKFISLIAAKGNIILLCREHHRLWEDNEWSDMRVAPIIIKQMIGLALQAEEPLKSSLYSYLINKIWKTHEKRPSEWLGDLLRGL